MTRIFNCVLILAISLSASAQPSAKNSLSGFRLGEKQTKFLRENPGCKKADSLHYHPQGISVKAMKLFDVEAKDGIGNPVHVSCLFYDKELAVIVAQYEGLTDCNGIIAALNTKYGKYQSYITSQDIGCGAGYRTKEIIRWMDGKNTVYLTYIPEIRFAQVVLADQVLQDKSKSEIPKHPVKSL